MFTPEQAADEERRAQLWRDQQARRVEYQTGLWFSRLAGNPAAYVAFVARWAALVAWLVEGDEPIVDPEDDPGFDPLGISDSVNVGT